MRHSILSATCRCIIYCSVPEMLRHCIWLCESHLCIEAARIAYSYKKSRVIRIITSSSKRPFHAACDNLIDRRTAHYFLRALEANRRESDLHETRFFFIWACSSAQSEKEMISGALFCSFKRQIFVMVNWRRDHNGSQEIAVSTSRMVTRAANHANKYINCAGKIYISQ